jgi:tRNA A-37 threonylcarbamoyl transferase component Bud32
VTVPKPHRRQTSARRQAPGTGCTKIGKYLLERPIGRGGMATVYAAREVPAGRTVAVKVLTVPPQRTPADVAALVGRMRREARAISRLSHPNIVRVFDMGEEDGVPFLVMEYLEGVTLREHLDAEGPLPPARAAEILDQVAQALDAAHAEGVLHRDIKPSNVMLVSGSAHGSPAGVKLMDFGVARQNDDTRLTRTGVMVGSPAYMAPEAVRGERPAPAADVWALGVLLYEMLAGRPPFAAETIPTVFYRILHEAPAPVPADTNPAARRVLARALEKNPVRRFASGRELAAAFRDAVIPSAPPARHAFVPAAAARAVSMFRSGSRSRRPAAAVLALLLLAGAMGALVGRSRHGTGPAARPPAAPVLGGIPPRASGAARVPRRPPSTASAPRSKARPVSERPLMSAAVVSGANKQPKRPARDRASSPGTTSAAPVRVARNTRPAAAATPPRAGTALGKSAVAKTRRGHPAPAAQAAAAKRTRSRRATVGARPPLAQAHAVEGARPRSRPLTSTAALLRRRVQLARDYVRLRGEAGRVDRTDPAAVAAYNRKVYAFRRVRDRFNTDVRRSDSRRDSRREDGIIE